MGERKAWHSQDEFWDMVGPLIFDSQRLSNASAEVEKISGLLQMKKQDRVLDLCCGIGRHSLELARRGYAVVGVDRTNAYIDRARQTAAEEGLRAEFVVGDMREYCIPRSYDVIVNLFGSFGYFDDLEDDRQVVKNMYASLRTGGRFMIETMGKEILARDFQEKDWSEKDDLLVLTQRRISQNWERVETRWIAIRGDQRAEFNLSVRSWSAVELSTLLHESGFSDVQVYGDIEGAAYDQAAKRLVIVGNK